MEIVLYYAPNTCAMAPYITLSEAGATFEARPLNFRKGQQNSAEYLKLNPKHKVPLLVVDGRTLTENAAIHIWVSRQFPQAKLFPSDPWQELQAISILSWCASGMHPYLSRINSPSRVCDLPNAEESVVRASTKLLHESFEIADGMLARREYFFDHFTAPDAHFMWAFRRAQQLGVDVSRFENCLRHFERMKQRASVQKVLAYEASVQAEFARAA